MEGKYHVTDVARYTVMVSNELNNLRLQTLLFFLDGYSLSTRDAHCSLFKEDILAWKHGPVVLEAYDLFKEYGYDPIYDPDKILQVTIEKGRFKWALVDWVNPIQLEDRLFIKRVVGTLRDYADRSLTAITQSLDSWKDHLEGVIPKEAILADFNRALCLPDSTS